MRSELGWSPVARLCSGIAGVDQQRLAVRRDEQRAAAAFDIDGDHLQGVVLRGRRHAPPASAARNWMSRILRSMRRLPKNFRDTRAFAAAAARLAPMIPITGKAARSGRWIFRHPPAAADRAAQHRALRVFRLFRAGGFRARQGHRCAARIPISGWPPSPICSTARRCTATPGLGAGDHSPATSTG